ncbi:hypothetical protein MAXJ12_06223 [Mesorhizobium alhagi CCNWXJ12-2]|uniref:Uncharacterized protein n=1 Tax=Mesorhizobium alhagi CCNWXJ12-2 TaxID=1107882 RepID=H0HM81_9HYPH|nr:hypothetical protein MAXJ12_06223 [Mesorhizobium alhagi CCNWXJ12-2]
MWYRFLLAVALTSISWVAVAQDLFTGGVYLCTVEEVSNDMSSPLSVGEKILAGLARIEPPTMTLIFEGGAGRQMKCKTVGRVWVCDNPYIKRQDIFDIEKLSMVLARGSEPLEDFERLSCSPFSF